MIRGLAVTALLAVSVCPGWGRELRSFYDGVRPLGMGGAFLAVADDENAVHYNPAGLAGVTGPRVGVVNPYIEFGEGGYDFARDAIRTNLDDPEEVVRLIQDHVGGYQHYRAYLFPHYLRPGLELGLLLQGEGNFQPNNSTFPESEVDLVSSLSGHAGYARALVDDRLRLGGALKLIRGLKLERVYTVTDILAPDFEDQVRDDLERGGGFGLDLGAQWVFPARWETTLAAVWRDVGATDLGDAGQYPQTFDLGAAVRHGFDWADLVLAADWVDVTTNAGSDDSLGKRLHFGAEARLPRWVSLRLGLNQGYGAWGVTGDLRYLRLDYASYAEEVGAEAGERSDRRHVFQVSLGW